MKCPNLEVPSSFVDPVQDPGIKGALFQEDCRQDLGIAGETMSLACLRYARLFFSKQVGASAASANAGESKEITELPGVCETDFAEKVGSSVAVATAGEHKSTHGLLEVLESEFSSKSGSAAVAATVSAETAHQAGVLHGTFFFVFEFTNPSSWTSFTNSWVVSLSTCTCTRGCCCCLACWCLLLGLPPLLLPLLHGFLVRLLQLLLILQVHVPHLHDRCI